MQGNFDQCILVALRNVAVQMEIDRQGQECEHGSLYCWPEASNQVAVTPDRALGRLAPASTPIALQAIALPTF